MKLLLHEFVISLSTRYQLFISRESAVSNGQVPVGIEATVNFHMFKYNLTALICHLCDFRVLYIIIGHTHLGNTEPNDVDQEFARIKHPE